MLENSALYSRPLFVLCAAVMSFIMCSDAARASPVTTQVDTGVRRNVLRRLYSPYSQHHPLSTGLTTKTGRQTETNAETEAGGNYREFPSIIDRQSKPLQFIDGSFGYNQNIPDKREFQAGTTGVQSEVRSASGIFTSHSQQLGGQSFERPQSRVNYQPLSQKVSQSGNSHYSHPVIIRKSSHKEAAGPFHQSSGPSPGWDSQKDAQKSYNKEKLPGNDSPKVGVWQPSDSSLFSSQAGRYWSASLPTSRGHYSGYKETNELAAVGPWSTSSGIQSGNFLGFASQTAPHAPSISNSLDASVIKSNPSPEKPPSSITDFSQGLSSSETPRHKKIQSYLFKDSQNSLGGHKTLINTVTGNGHSTYSTTSHQQSPSDAQIYGWFPSNFKQSQSKKPTKEVQHLSNVNPVYHNANMAQYGVQTGSFINYEHTTAESLPQMSVHPAPGTGNTMESVVPTPHKVYLANYANVGEKPAVSGQVNATKPERTTKSIYGFRGFTNPSWRGVTEPSSHQRTNSQRLSFDKGKLKIANKYPSLSPKYRFGQRESSTVTTSPAKLERAPSPGTLHVVPTMRPFTSRVKEVRPPLPENDAAVDSNPDRRQFRIHKRIYGLKGFGSRPHEGAKPPVKEPDKPSRVQQGFGGFKPRSLQIWQPKSSRIQRWFNKTKPGSSHESTESQNDLKPSLKTTESTEAVTSFIPDKYKGFQNRIGNAFNTHWKYKGQNPTPVSASHIISSVYLRSADDLKVESSQIFEPRTPNKTRPVAVKASLLSSSTSSTVRGKRVKGTNGKKLNESASLTNSTGKVVAIFRLPERPARVKAVTYTDILGSASFSSVRTSIQTPITPADKNYSPNITATTEKKEEAGHWTLKSEDAVHNTSRGLQDEDEGEDFISVEENKLAVRSEEVDSDMKTLDLFLDNEGSGSGAFNMSDVLSADTTNSQRLGKDLLKLDNLWISTGNISFNSMKLSHTDK